MANVCVVLSQLYKLFLSSLETKFPHKAAYDTGKQTFIYIQPPLYSHHSAACVIYASNGWLFLNGRNEN